jgi:fatty-acyl-CoA synthase
VIRIGSLADAVSGRAWPGSKTPKDVRFVDELPKNVSGKILKRELRDLFGDG